LPVWWSVGDALLWIVVMGSVLFVGSSRHLTKSNPSPAVGQVHRRAGLPRPEISNICRPYRGAASQRPNYSPTRGFDAIGCGRNGRFRTDKGRNLEWNFNGKPPPVFPPVCRTPMGTYDQGQRSAQVGRQSRSALATTIPIYYLVGSGTFPNAGQANTTLTIAALCLRTGRIRS